MCAGRKHLHCSDNINLRDENNNFSVWPKELHYQKLWKVLATTKFPEISGVGWGSTGPPLLTLWQKRGVRIGADMASARYSLLPPYFPHSFPFISRGQHPTNYRQSSRQTISISITLSDTWIKILEQVSKYALTTQRSMIGYQQKCLLFNTQMKILEVKNTVSQALFLKTF